MSPGHRKLPPTLATSCTSHVQAGFGSFPYQLTFKFGESREETKYQLTAGAGRIDVCALAGKDFKADTAGRQVVDRIDKVAQIAS